VEESEGMRRTRLLRWRVAVHTALVVLGIIAALVISAFSLEFISLSPLFTSVVAGGVFVLWPDHGRHAGSSRHLRLRAEIRDRSE